ncbi:DUF4190 domain-containing protein [Actinotalea sp. BY-33]|uniref:DUF4190 domain-containing protein n=1 Tax=Actinotalea soli TaxID=2819234 RepID=A0A939LS01_9CELL|nr:DUF4190 domain-containing protein [Actinotalea soli]MBO1750272.1 DUF4190 domain-containing protein [Actinotalea soli]
MSNPTGPQDPYGAQPPSGGYGAQPPAGGGGYGAPPPPPAYGGARGGGYGTEKNSLGVWALVLGILGVLCCGLGFIFGIPALIVGNKSKEAARNGQANNGGLGQAGVVLGWIAIAFSVLWLIYVFAFGGLTAFNDGFTTY